MEIVMKSDIARVPRPHQTQIDLFPFGKIYVLDNLIGLQAGLETNNYTPRVNLFVVAPKSFVVLQNRSLEGRFFLPPQTDGVHYSWYGVNGSEGRRTTFVGERYRLDYISSQLRGVLFRIQATDPIAAMEYPEDTDLVRMIADYQTRNSQTQPQSPAA